MAELGFQRSAKKCKEKLENVYKYHKRTKDGRATKSDGNTYRFFDQLEAFETAPPPPFTPPPPRPQLHSRATMPVTKPATCSLPMPSHNVSTVLSTSPIPLSIVPPIHHPSNLHSWPFHPPPLQPPPQAASTAAANASNPNDFERHLDSTSSSSMSLDEDIQRRRGKKRKWKDIFHRFMKEVVDLQKFLDTLNREHVFLVQERSIAAAKDAAVVAFLQKVTEQNNLQIPITNFNSPAPSQHPMQPPPPAPPRNPHPPLPPTVQQTPTFPPPIQVSALTLVKTPDTSKTDNRGDGGGWDGSMAASSLRWLKAEVQALISLRTSLDIKNQENGPKGPLWEEISAAMIKMGYNRSSKRCKEKWENINKYFKKVKESSKKRPEDSKTCPYFHQLDAIYRERAKNDAVPFSQGYTVNAEPIMAWPEQQWPLPEPKPPGMKSEDVESENNDED